MYIILGGIFIKTPFFKKIIPFILIVTIFISTMGTLVEAGANVTDPFLPTLEDNSEIVSATDSTYSLPVTDDVHITALQAIQMNEEYLEA